MHCRAAVGGAAENQSASPTAAGRALSRFGLDDTFAAKLLWDGIDTGGANHVDGPVTRRLTAEEFFEFCSLPENEELHFELEDGEIIELLRPVVPHGVVCGNLAYLLGAYVRKRRRGYVCSNDTGVVWKRDPDTVRGPDVLPFLTTMFRSMDCQKSGPNDHRIWPSKCVHPTTACPSCRNASDSF